MLVEARKRRAATPARLFGRSRVTGFIGSSLFSRATTSRSCSSAAAPYAVVSIRVPLTMPPILVRLSPQTLDLPTDRKRHPEHPVPKQQKAKTKGKRETEGR